MLEAEEEITVDEFTSYQQLGSAEIQADLPMDMLTRIRLVLKTISGILSELADNRTFCMHPLSSVKETKREGYFRWETGSQQIPSALESPGTSLEGW